jgi:hypothetical protein
MIETADGILSVRPGTAAPAGLRPSGIVTAFNPASQPRDEDANRRADAELRDRFAALEAPVFHVLARAPGDDRAWDEPGRCVLTGDRDALVALGESFGQNAIVWIGDAGEVSLVCTRDGFCGARVGEVLEAED